MATSEPSGSSHDLYCFTQTSNSVTYHDHITEKLKDFSQGVTCDPPTSLKGCFTSLQGSSVLECVVSGNHIALLLEDGRICRIRYTEEHPPLPSNVISSNPSKEKSDDEGASTSSARSLGSRSASPRPDGEERPPTSALHSWGSLLTGAAVPSSSVGAGPGGAGSAAATFNVGNFARRGRIWLRRRGMGRSLIAARWPIVPASEVPDDLVDQAMAVLQGKSREAVIRELQRTSLDVNQAVNNLLSREDDDGDDEGETGIIRLGFPPGEELMSLLSSGLTGVAEEELEEVLGRSRSEEGGGGPPGGRESRVSLYEFSDPIFQNEIRSLVSLGDGAAGGGAGGSGLTLGPRGSGLGSLGGNTTGTGGGESSSKRSSSGRTNTGGSKKKKENSSGPLLFDNAVEWWKGEKDGVRFRHIAELYSDLLAVDTEGNLHSWAWSSPVPSSKGHPRVAELQLENEKIKLISAKILRASVVTESGKLATFLDSTVSSVSSQLEQKAQHFSELNGETISALHVSELLSTVVTESGKIYWWGVLPLNERKQAIIQNTERIRLYKYHSNSHAQQPLVEGSQVCLRTSPIFSAGAKAIHMKGTQIQCGVLQEDVMSPTLSEKCQFHVIPSPSSSPPSSSSSGGGPTVHCEPVKAEEQEDMETEGRGGQLSVTINVHVGSKRRHSDDSCQDGSSSRFSQAPKSEVWSLRDVIFTDHVTNVKVGSVVKLDGNYVAVHYPSLSQDELSAANLDNCRLLRKDELVPARESSPHQAPYFLQETPKKLRYPSFYNLLTLACDLRGIHALFSAHSQVDYVLFNLNTSEFSQNGPFGELNSQYLLKQGMPLRLVTINSNLGVVLDQHGGMFPISKNSAGNLRDLQLLNLPPVHTVGVGVCSTKNSLVAVSFRKQMLIPLVLRCDYSAIRMLMERLKGDPVKLTSVLKERCSGGCNVFHVLAALSKPQEPQSSSGSSSTSGGEKRGVAARTTPRGGMLREIMKQAMALASASGSSYPHPPMDWTSDEGEDGSDFACMANTAADILHMLSSLEGYQEVLTQLLQQKNLEGYTPFMAAVAYKAYNVARMLFDVANQLSESQEEVSLLSMVYPTDCHPDDNPVFILCRSDTCSFTWTGEEHIHQDIFECRTCGLTGSLCCCTECAYTCHRGHDCSFKRVSPTAYCDCWEMCKCKALAPSSDYERKSLLVKLLSQTSLGAKVNSSQEHLLGMLAAMVARQAKEQAHWSGRQLRSLSKHHDDSRPVCDLPPPKFAQKALSLVLEDWVCVKATLMGGDRGEGLGEGFSGQSVEGGEFGTNLLSTRQSTTIPMDAFTYTILTKLHQKSLDSLLTVLVKEMGPERKNVEAVQVAERFVRSVVRVFTVCHTESVCVPSGSLISTSSSSARKKSASYNQLIERSSRVFTSLTPLAVRQLVPMARAIILPVVMGIAKPVDLNCMSDRRKTGEDIFRLPPASLLRVPACEDEPVEGAGGSGGGGVDHDAESEMGDGEEEMTSMGVPAHDASSTATTGSNLLYLSDQESSDGEELESGGDDLSMEDSHQEDDGLLDPPITHRVTLDSHWAMPSSRLGHASHHHGSSSRNISRPGSSATRESRHDSLLSMGKSSTLLAQIFSLLVRQLAETLDNIYEVSNCPTPPYVLPALGTDPTDLYKFVWAELEEVWVWLFNSMDMLESQLRFGSSMSRKIPPKETSSSSSKRESNSESLESRKQFFAYILTLLRGQFCEMEGMLPAVDVTNMEHLAWTFDALFYLLQNIRSPQLECPDQDASKPVPDIGKESCDFFRRSTSTLCLGLIPPSPFDPMCDALPIAEKPQLMDGVQEKEILFGQHYSTLLQQWPYCPLPHPPLSNLFSNGSGPLSGIYMWPKQPKALVEQELDLELSQDDLCGWDSHRLAASVLVGRWSSCLKVFATAFMDTVGRQSGSVLSEEQIFEQREKEFRREMDHLRTASHKDILLEVERSPDKLLSCIFTKLNQFSERQTITMSQGNSQPLCVHKVKVSFDGEPGEGSGVLRSLFTAAAEAIVSEEPLPIFDFIGGKITCNPGSGSVGKTSRSKEKDKEREKQGQARASGSGKQPTKQGPSSEAPLFYQPGKAGFYAPRVGTNTPERLNAYRNVGRLIGLSLLFSEVMPMPLCRHVFKFILIRTIRWHDLAFFDPAVYESLRKMILDSRKLDGAECLATLGLTFAVNLRPEEGGETVELIPNGSSVAVTPSNVLDYVKKYAMLRMIKINGESLQQMRKGLHEVLPGSCFSGLSAEDFRLLLCGCPHIDVDVVRGITLFQDESRKEQDTLSRFKSWFWSVLERMTQRERQDLLYFWTSSPVLPASVDSYQPAPSVTIRPPDDQRLPTANTCISRLYIPLYSSKAILKTRLVTAIKTKTFGFV